MTDVAPNLPQLDRVNIQVFLCPMPTKFQQAKPQLGKLLMQIEALGAEVQFGNFSERLQSNPHLDIIARRNDGVVFELSEQITPGDHVLIYSRQERLLSMVVVDRIFAELLTEKPTVSIAESRPELGQ